MGAIGVGGSKMKIHRAAIEKLFTANDLVLDAEEVFEIGQSLSSSRSIVVPNSCPDLLLELLIEGVLVAQAVIVVGSNAEHVIGVVSTHAQPSCA